MSEFIGFAYYTEIPSVFFNVQRVGPSTGMPTRTQQCDIMMCAYASHGDTQHPLLLPANPYECFEMAVSAFDLAERLQTPVFVLSDLDIGMNDWMIPELKWDDSYRPDRGKVLSSDDVDKLEKFYRYLDVDGDGIAARTLPGENAKGAYFVRGSGHNKHGMYTESSEEYKDLVDRLLVKWDTARTLVPKPVLIQAEKETSIGIVAYGSSDGAVTRSAGRPARSGHPCGLYACSRFSVQRRGYTFCRAARNDICRRTKSRCATAFAADPGNQYRCPQTDTGFALQRNAHSNLVRG